MECKKFTCAICLEDGFEASEILRSCQADGKPTHIFCKPCFADWEESCRVRRRGLACPVCGQSIDFVREEIPDGVHTVHLHGERIESHYKDGLKEGEEMVWDAEGILRWRHFYTRGLKNGISQCYREDGSGTLLKECRYVKGVLHGVYRTYYEDGKLEMTTEFFHGKEHGSRKEYYPSGKVATSVVVSNGRIHGVKTTWYEDGTLQKREGYNFGRRIGIGQKWYPSGKIMQEYYLNESQQYVGTYREWFPSGEKKIECHYINYIDGDLEKTYTEWDATGTLVAKRFYEKGTLREE